MKTMRGILKYPGLRLAFLTMAGVLLATPTWAIGTRATTSITNTARVDFKDVNGNNLFQNSNTVTTVVSQVGGVLVDPNNTNTLAPGTTWYYPHTVTNTGNYDDYANIVASSSHSWAITIYKDVNGNGTYEAGTDTVLADSAGDSDAIPDSGLLANDGFMKILVALTVPAGVADGTIDVVTVTGTSFFDGAKTDNALDTTTVSAPNMAVVKSVSPVGAQPPGTVLTYTIVVTNNGTGAANTVVMTDPIPTNTTYQAASITYNAAARTDAADVDNADYNVSNVGKVTVNVGALAAAGGTATITFKVTIN